jgi:hypothetical protein
LNVSCWRVGGVIRLRLNIFDSGADERRDSHSPRF